MNIGRAVILLTGFGILAGPAHLGGRFLTQAKQEVADCCSEVGAHAPSAGTPAALTFAWLQFHERELCLGLETVFKFDQKELEVSCRIEDEKSYEKMIERFEPLRATYPINIYPTRPPAENKSHEEKEPPPSLWNNTELRLYLEDHPTDNQIIHERGAWGGTRMEREFSLKQRMILFGDQMIEWDKKMRRYAADLPALVFVATNPSIPNELRHNAAAVCEAHLQGIHKCADRLEQSLSRALPKASKKPGLSAPELSDAGETPAAEAARISNEAQEVARRIDIFIHPRQHTVALSDLREPDLLESLESLRRMLRGFQEALRTRPLKAPDLQ